MEATVPPAPLARTTGVPPPTCVVALRGLEDGDAPRPEDGRDDAETGRIRVGNNDGSVDAPAEKPAGRPLADEGLMGLEGGGGRPMLPAAADEGRTPGRGTPPLA